MIRAIDNNIWTVDGPDVVFAGAAMHTRMTVVRLSTDQLWVHSPIVLDDSVKTLIEELGGEVVALIAPNKFHHLYIESWRSAYPSATVFAEEHVARKVPSLANDTILSNTTPDLYSDDIDQVVLSGNRLFQEVVFFHHESGALIFTDLMINLKTDNIKLLPRLFLEFEGVTYPDGGIPRLYKWLSNKEQARAAYTKISSWQPRHVLFCHGETFALTADELLAREFSYLNPNK